MCSGGWLYCPTLKTCVSKEKVCDGQSDCPDQIDESIQCTQCPDNFCKNNGVCTPHSSGSNCTCPVGDNVGLYRCYGSLSGTAAPVVAPSSNKLVVALSVSGSVLAVGLVLIVIYFVMRRQRAEDSKMTQGLTNPVYDMQMGDMGDVGGSVPFDDVAGPSGAMENPLYGDRIDA